MIAHLIKFQPKFFWRENSMSSGQMRWLVRWQILSLSLQNRKFPLKFCMCNVFCCSVAKSCLTLRPHGLQYARLLCPPLSPGVCSNSGPLSQWCYLAISSSAIPFSSCLRSFPASGSFPVSQLFASGGQSIEVSASNQSFQCMLRTDLL